MPQLCCICAEEENRHCIQTEHDLWVYPSAVSACLKEELTWGKEDVFHAPRVEWGEFIFPPRLALCLCCLFTSHAFNSSLHYIALTFSAIHLVGVCVCAYERKQTKSVLSIPTTRTSSSLLISIMREREREREREEGNDNNLNNLVAGFIFWEK